MSPDSKPRRLLRLRRDVASQAAEEVDAEIRFHLESRTLELVAGGADPSAARRQAEREFGDVDRARVSLRALAAETERSVRRTEWRHEVGQDVRYGWRRLVRAPGFTLVAVLTLALGIGATTAIFSIVNGVLLRPLPFAAPERLVRVWETSPKGDPRNVVSAGNYVDWRARARSFSALGAFTPAYGRGLTGDGEPTKVLGSDVTPSVLEVLGVPPLFGRPFREEDSRGDGRVVLLSHRLWQQRFGGDRAVVGRRLVLDDVAYTVVGVMPAGFSFPDATTDLWRPVTGRQLDATERRSHNWFVVGRLRPGVTRAQAQAEMTALAASLTREYPQFMTGYGVNVAPLLGDLVADVRPLLLVLLGGVALVLLIACANIANLLLARSLAREREMAVRGALGAGRGRLARQLLTESLLLALLGGALGVAFAAAALRGLLALAPADMPRLDAVRLDPTVLAFAAGATLLSTLAFGLLPALRLSRPDLQGALRAARDAAGGVRNARLRGALLVGEVALSLLLLSGAGLLVRSFQRLREIDYGFRPDGLLAVSLTLPRARYADTPRHVDFFREAVDAVRQLAGVAGVAGTTATPGAAGPMTFSFAIQGRPSRNPSGREDPEELRVVTPGYFRTLGVPLLSGRVPDERDRADAPPVVVVNRALARKLWPGDDPVGRRISFQGPEGPWLEIVGVVGDTRLAGADQPPVPAVYLPHAQKPWPWMAGLTLVVRARPGQDPRLLGPAIREAIWRLDPRLSFDRIETVDALYRESTARRRFATTLLGAFSAAALLLGMVGLYGVLSYTVAQRRQEIGIRIALGAARRQVVGVVMRQALGLVGAGVAIGLVAALALTRALRSLLFEVSPTDPVTFVAVAALLAGIAAAAAWIPARRAARIDPAVVIRDG